MSLARGTLLPVKYPATSSSKGKCNPYILLGLILVAVLTITVAITAIGIPRTISFTSQLANNDAYGPSNAAKPEDTRTASQRPQGAPIPKIIHHMHKDLEALSPVQRRLYDKCKQLHPEWQMMFWDDAKLDEFIKTKFSWYYETWKTIEPLIKRLDSSRYMLMHHYGGIYLDVDVECVTPLDSLIEPLPRGSAWMGDFPEPMFVMSSPGAKLWLTALERIKRVWRDLDAWHSTGPAGLNAAVLEHIQLYGTDVFVPYITHRPEPAFHDFIKHKNNTLPYFMLANRDRRLPKQGSGFGPALTVWYSKEHQSVVVNSDADLERVEALKASDSSDVVRDVSLRVGFVANELLDPAGCGGHLLNACKDGWCNSTWPMSYLVHHCLNTWRGRIGTT